MRSTYMYIFMYSCMHVCVYVCMHTYASMDFFRQSKQHALQWDSNLGLDVEPRLVLDQHREGLGVPIVDRLDHRCRAILIVRCTCMRKSQHAMQQRPSRGAVELNISKRRLDRTNRSLAN